jgi:hypothetical protein
MAKRSIVQVGPRAVPVGSYAGKAVYRVPVRVHVHGGDRLDDWLDTSYTEHLVLAQSAALAANWVRDNLVSEPQTTITAFGPAGGKLERFVGWESYIGNQLWTADRSQQRLPFSQETS